MLADLRKFLLLYLRIHHIYLWLFPSHLALLLDLFLLDDAVDLLVAVVLSLLADVGGQRAQKLRSSFDQHLSPCVHIQRGKEGHILVDLVDNRWIVVVIGVGVACVLGLGVCSVLLADEMHELLLLEVFGQAVEGFLVNASVPEEGLRESENAQDFTVSDWRLVCWRVDCGRRDFNFLDELLLDDVRPNNKRNLLDNLNLLSHDGNNWLHWDNRLYWNN